MVAILQMLRFAQHGRAARLLLGVLLGGQTVLAAQVAGPLTASQDPNYFKDANGTVLILNGSQTWNTLQDWGSNGTVEKLDFDAYVNFLKAHGHNFTLLWRVEMPRFCGLPITSNSPPDFTVDPHPWLRTGPGKATDGGLKFDLTKFDQSFFNRLRARAEALNKAGIFVGVYLFTGEFLNTYRCPADGYPFSGANNINGIDDDYTAGRQGIGSITMTAPNAITAFQDAYVEKAVDTLNDLPNLLWIVSEEAPAGSTWWNSHQIAHLRAYESRKPHQHPIGYAALIGLPDDVLYNSDADWVAPQARISPEKSCGNGKPACKVDVNDSDHSYWEIWNDTPQQARNYAWENFMTGNQVLFMDPYVVYYPRQKRNLCVSPSHGICSGPDTRYDNLRDNLGYILKYSRRLNLAAVTPHASLSSTKYCLAQTPSKGAEYLVYAPSGGTFTMDLSAMPSSRSLAVEWFNPSTGVTIPGKPIPAGSASQSFTPLFNHDAVLYLVDAEGHAPEHLSFATQDGGAARQEMVKGDLGIDSRTILGITLGRSNLAEVQARLGRARLWSDGDASTAESKVCYVTQEPNALVLVFASNAEMAGSPEYQVTDIRISKKMAYAERAKCLPLAIPGEEVFTRSGLRIGLSRRAIRRILGPPQSATPSTWSYFWSIDRQLPTSAETYAYWLSRKKECFDGKMPFFSIGSEIAAEFQGDAVTALRLSRMESIC